MKEKVTQLSGLSDYEIELDKLADTIKKTTSSLECIGILRKFIYNNMPSINEANKIAITISEDVKPKLTASEQSFFIAGFQECIKWLSNKW